jgi:hypothetical protein
MFFHEHAGEPRIIELRKEGGSKIDQLQTQKKEEKKKRKKGHPTTTKQDDHLKDLHKHRPNAPAQPESVRETYHSAQ